MRCPNCSDKHTAPIVATNTLPGDLIPWGTKSPGDLVPRGIKLLVVPNHRDSGTTHVALCLSPALRQMISITWWYVLQNLKVSCVTWVSLGQPLIVSDSLSHERVVYGPRDWPRNWLLAWFWGGKAPVIIFGGVFAPPCPPVPPSLWSVVFKQDTLHVA